MKKIYTILKYRYFYIISIVSLFFLFDQATKEIAMRLLNIGESFPSEGFFRFTHVRNFGSAFSIIEDANLFLLIVGIAAIILILYFLIIVAKGSILLEIAISLQLSGAIGNIMDRVRHGSVTDFIDIGIWPVFNIADSCISVGMALLILHLIIEWKEGKGNPIEDNL